MIRRFVEWSPVPKATLRQVLARVPMDRMLQPEEISAGALTLVSNNSL